MSKKEELIKKYGAECMLEATDTRYISDAMRKYLKGYKKSDDKLQTYKDYLMKEYNKKWFKQQSKDKQKEIEKEMNEHKMYIAKMKLDKGVEMEAKEIGFDMTDTIDIPLVPNKIEREEER